MFSLVNESVVHPSVVVQYGSRIYKSSILRYTYVNNNCYIINTSVGSFCSIANHVMIGGGQHPIHFVSSSPIFYSKNNVFKKYFHKTQFQEYLETIIGNDVWIGTNAFIKGGITIGHGAIIGAHAVVTKDVEPYSIVVGNPGRVIKKRFSEEIIAKLLEAGWWDWTEEELSARGFFFENINSFLEKKLL
jgi:acetyltransferase-like isoleucine patch superfamily enzyme